MSYDGIANKSKPGKYNIGLMEYQENDWVNAIREYGPAIMNKSLLSKSQRIALVNIAKR